MLLHRTNAIGAMCVILGGLATATLGQPMEVVAQGIGETPVAPAERGAVEQGTTGTAPVDQGTTGTAPTTPTPRTDQAIAEQQRRTELERRADQERLARAQRYRDDHRHHGETYVAGFGGVTFGGTTTNMEGRGSALGVSIDNPSLADSAVYGLKIGYFHPGRLNWLGLELEGFNLTPHMMERGGLPGSHLRITTLGF